MCTGLAKLRALEVIGLEQRPTSAAFAGRTRRGSFPPGSFPRCATRRRAGSHRDDRRQRVHRAVSVPSRAASRSGRARARARSRRDRRARGSGIFRRRSIAIPPPGNRELVSRLRPVRRSAARRARDSTGLAALGARRCGRGGCGRSGGSRLSAAVGHRVRTTPRCASWRSPRASREWRSLLTVRFEDLRQRHSMDIAGDLSAAAIRALARAGDVGATRRDRGVARNDRGSALGSHPDRAAARVLGHLVDLGSAGGSPGEAVSHDRRAAIRVRDAVAAAADADAVAPISICFPTTRSARSLADARDDLCTVRRDPLPGE